MNAADIMTRHPVTVRSDARLSEVVHLMLEHHISGIPVAAGNGELVGIVTEGDLLRRAETATDRRRPRWLEFIMGPGRLAEDYVHTHARKIEMVMTTDVVSVTADTPLSDVVALMEGKHVKRLPVVAGNICVGIVSRADLIRALGRVLDGADRPGRSHTEIREHILREVGGSAWGKGARITVTVDNGVVDLDGVIFDERERKAFRVAAETTPGVKEVRDHITWIEPNSGVAFRPNEEVSAPTAPMMLPLGVA